MVGRAYWVIARATRRAMQFRGLEATRVWSCENIVPPPLARSTPWSSRSASSDAQGERQRSQQCPAQYNVG
eukprot:14661624-Alexandrium_andersonii.AAC.1